MIALVTEKREQIAGHCRRLNVRRLDIFGSAATGAFDPEKSDLDFLVEFENFYSPGIARRYLDLAESLEVLFDKKVDLITPDSVRNPYFRASLEASREVVYGV